MKRRLRQRQILELLQITPELSVGEVCARLGASPATVRREFAHLHAEGRVEKTGGGIRAASSAPIPVGPPAFGQRLATNTAEKRAIAKAAAGLLEDGDVVMIDGGTTTFQLCEFIALKPIRIITNSLVIAHAVDRFRGSRRGAEVHLSGGQLHPESGIVAGPQAEAFLRQYHAKWTFLGAAGVDETAATNYNEAVLASERLMIAQSDRIALLADHSKFGRTAMCVLCPLEAVSQLITDAHPETQTLVRRIRNKGVDVTEVVAR
jgi:DeoR/GlpR family transcriptional regulator of sugar metabolism